MKFHIGALVSTLWLFAAPLASAETVKVGVVPNVYAQSIEALIPEAKARYRRTGAQDSGLSSR